MAGASLQPIYERLNGTDQYHPFTADTFQDWSLEAGDVISVSKGNETYSSPVFVSKMKWTGHPSNKLETTGEKQRQAISRQSKQKFSGGGGGVNNSKALYYLTQDFDDQKGLFEQYITGEDGLIHTVMWQRQDAVGAIAGDFTKGSDGNYRLSSGTEFLVDKGGTYQTVGTEAQIDDVQDNVDAVDGRVQTIEGSALWTQRNQITGVVGEYDVVTDPTTGVKTLVVKSGGGIKIRRGNVEYGLYDNGNLTAGIIVNKINGGASTVKISADHIVLDGDAVASSLDSHELSCGDFSANQAQFTNFTSHGASEIEGNLTISTGTVIVGEQDLADGFINVTKTTSGNEVTLTFTTANGDEIPITFNRATTPTMSDSWSGGSGGSASSMNVTTDPQPVRSFTYHFPVTNSATLGRKVSVNRSGDQGQTVTIGTIDLTSIYDSGWGDAYGKVVFPSISTSSPSMSIKTPSSTVGGQSTTTYTLALINSSTLGRYVNLSGPNSNTYARVDVSAVYNSGMADEVVTGYDAGSYEITSGSGSTANITYSGRAVFTSGKAQRFTLSTVPTTIYRDGYAKGLEDCVDGLTATWSAPSANRARVAIDSNPATGDPFYQYVATADPTWQENVATIRILHSDNNSSYYATGATITVDATARYNAGYNSGVAHGKTLVDLQNFTWSGGIATCKDNWSGATKTDTIFASAYTYGTETTADHNTITTTIQHGSAQYPSSTGLSKSQVLYVTCASQNEGWSSGQKYVYLRLGTETGTIIARKTVIMPQATQATWSSAYMSPTQLQVTCTLGGRTMQHTFNV